MLGYDIYKNVSSFNFFFFKFINEKKNAMVEKKEKLIERNT